MELSELVTQGLTAWVAGDNAQESPRPIRWGGIWFCPADGNRMDEAEGLITCRKCGRHLPPRLLYQLIEFHRHSQATHADQSGSAQQEVNESVDSDQ